MKYTHTFDLVHRILLFAGSVTLVVISVDFLEPGWNALASWNPFDGFDLVLAVAAIAGFFGGLYLSAKVLERTLLPGWAFTWAYALTSAHVRLSTDEAERLTPLVDGSCPTGWLNLTRIRTLSREERKVALSFVANRFAQENGRAVPFPAVDEAMRQAEQAEEQAKRRAAEEEAHRKAREERKASGGEYRGSNGGAGASGTDAVTQALAVLGFTGGRPPFEVIRHVYRKKIADYHPDRFEGKDEALRRFVEDRAKAINAAYQVLECAYGAKS